MSEHKLTRTVQHSLWNMYTTQNSQTRNALSGQQTLKFPDSLPNKNKDLTTQCDLQ